jgi:hypothetical protein
MDKSPLHPHFLIVGAPKCGTTSLHHYLAQHPSLFLAPKEMHYFGRDLHIKNHTDSSSYFNSFAQGANKLRGEASVWYLYSKTAPQEILEQLGKIKIIICLRRPDEMIYSLHRENLFNADEDEKNFEEALALEFYRKANQKIPASARFKQCLLYRNNGLYSERIQLYLNTFGAENVYFVLAEDLKENPLAETNKVLSFLNQSKLNALSADMHNTAKTYTSMAVHQKFKTASDWEKKIVRFLLPSKKLREKILKRIYNSNIKNEVPEKMADDVRHELQLFFSDDIKKTAKLIHRDLNHWIN